MGYSLVMAFLAEIDTKYTYSSQQTSELSSLRLEVGRLKDRVTELDVLLEVERSTNEASQRIIRELQRKADGSK